MPLLCKVLAVNAAIVLLGTVGATLSLRYAAGLDPPHSGLMLLFPVAVVAISLAASYLVLRFLLRPLDRLKQPVDTLRAGEPGARVAYDGFSGLLPGQILRAQEEERERIARELHDEAAQSITSLLVRLRLLEQSESPEAARQRVGELRELTMRALEDVRRIALELRPSLLDDLGLLEALHAYVDGLNAGGGTQVTLVTDGLNGRLPADVELVFYRVAQEALTNVRRHAQARQAQVRLHRSGSVVLLEVEDDGVGFDSRKVQAAGSGLGLAGMRERLALVGGEITVRSSPGRGTTVTARVDLAGWGQQGGR